MKGGCYVVLRTDVFGGWSDCRGSAFLAGVAAVAVQISWVLFLIGIVLVAIHVITGRTARVA
jgi:uncharacterized membrane protein YtjA (UPF0391 family)